LEKKVFHRKRRLRFCGLFSVETGGIKRVIHLLRKRHLADRPKLKNPVLKFSRDPLGPTLELSTEPSLLARTGQREATSRVRSGRAQLPCLTLMMTSRLFLTRKWKGRRLTYSCSDLVKSRGVERVAHFARSPVVKFKTLSFLLLLLLAGCDSCRWGFSRGRWGRGRCCWRALSNFEVFGEKKRVGGRLKMAQVWGLTSRSSSRQRVQKTDGKEGHRFAFRVAGTTPLLLSEVIHRPGRLPGLRPPPPLQPRTWARARAA
jgi:hypothetical protein